MLEFKCWNDIVDFRYRLRKDENPAWTKQPLTPLIEFLKRSELRQFQQDNMSWPSPYFVLTRGNKILKNYLSILHIIILQKWHFLIISYVTFSFTEIIFHVEHLKQLILFFLLEFHKHVYTLIELLAISRSLLFS